MSTSDTLSQLRPSSVKNERTADHVSLPLSTMSKIKVKMTKCQINKQILQSNSKLFTQNLKVKNPKASRESRF